MTHDHITNIETIFQNSTLLTKQGIPLSEANIPTLVLEWYNKNYQSSFALIQNKETLEYAILVRYCYGDKFCTSEKSRRFHVSRLAEASQFHLHNPQVTVCFGHKTAGDMDELSFVIPYGTSVKDVLSIVAPIRKKIDREFLQAKQSMNEVRQVAQMGFCC